MLSLITRQEVEELARDCGFYQRTPRGICAFEFVLCCALAAAAEAKRGFVSVWRLLDAAAGVKVARSAVTQRFGEGSAALLETMFHRVVERLPMPSHPELLARLKDFDQVLAHDGSVLALSPLLKKLFPATRTNTMDAAGKLHATADLIHRRIINVEITGERDNELAIARAEPIVANTLYINDLGYLSYDYFFEICTQQADFLSRLKENANPTIIKVAYGVRAPRRSEGMKLDDVELVASKDSFAALVALDSSYGPVPVYVYGLYNPETGKYHRYVTSLPPNMVTAEEIAALYSLRWIIELLFKLLKSSFHLDHLPTGNADAVRTHIYSSLLAAAIFTALTVAAAASVGIAPSEISPLVVGIAAPLLAVPLMLLWLGRELTYDELSAMIFRTIAVGCRDQNPKRTRAKWGRLS